MPVEINGQTYYRTSEACQKARVSRATLFRWLREGVLKKSYRDRRGWRLFTEDDLRSLSAEANRILVEDVPIRERTHNRDGGMTPSVSLRGKQGRWREA